MPEEKHDRQCGFACCDVLAVQSYGTWILPAESRSLWSCMGVGRACSAMPHQAHIVRAWATLLSSTSRKGMPRILRGALGPFVSPSAFSQRLRRFRFCEAVWNIPPPEKPMPQDTAMTTVRFRLLSLRLLWQCRHFQCSCGFVCCRRVCFGSAGRFQCPCGFAEHSEHTPQRGLVLVRQSRPGIAVDSRARHSLACLEGFGHSVHTRSHKKKMNLLIC